jgi:hypothetical protein
MEVEQLKLLKGRFNPKTLVAGKRGRAVTQSDILFRIDAKLFYPRDESVAIDAHACGSSGSTTDASLAFSKCVHDLFPLLLGIVVSNTFGLLQSIHSLFQKSGKALRILLRCAMRFLVRV